MIGEGGLLPNIYCAKAQAHGSIHIMEYRREGIQGEGYYCKICNSVEPELYITDEMVDSQISRRVIK